MPRRDAVTLSGMRFRSRVPGARVLVREPHVALPGPLAGAEVVAARGRRG